MFYVSWSVYKFFQSSLRSKAKFIFIWEKVYGINDKITTRYIQHCNYIKHQSVPSSKLVTHGTAFAALIFFLYRDCISGTKEILIAFWHFQLLIVNTLFPWPILTHLPTNLYVYSLPSVTVVVYGQLSNVFK